MTALAPGLDLQDYEQAFIHLSDKEITHTYRLFTLMNQGWLVNILSPLGMMAVKWRLPFAEGMIRRTMFKQFCGGVNLSDCTSSIEQLYEHEVQTVLDYGVEAKSTEEDFEIAIKENLSAMAYAEGEDAVPVVVVKVSALADNQLLEAYSAGKKLDEQQAAAWSDLQKRLDRLADTASRTGVLMYVDGEESWVQIAIDALTIDLMSRYNADRAVVYNTYQLYRHDKLEQLKHDYVQARAGSYILGAKLVRGAYMEKENRRAESKGYKSPIHISKVATDDDYNAALEYCAEKYHTIAICCATHNTKSTELFSSCIFKHKAKRDHPHFYFSQLYGMSDNLTFNLAGSGFNATKYMVYGPVRDVYPYLVRRARENSSLTGAVGREYSMVTHEMKRRGLIK